jgi:hypothetical protein
VLTGWLECSLSARYLENLLSEEMAIGKILDRLARSPLSVYKSRSVVVSRFNITTFVQRFPDMDYVGSHSTRMTYPILILIRSPLVLLPDSCVDLASHYTVD